MKKKKTVTAAKKAQSPTKTSAPAKAAAPAKPLGNLQKFANMLNTKREDILNTGRNKEVDLTFSDIGDEADVASQTFEREMMFELTNGDRIVLDDIEAALRKIEKGNFGICESCGQRIGVERLNAMPWARYCISCQSRAESPE